MADGNKAHEDLVPLSMVNEDDIGILDAALDSILQTNDPLLLPAEDLSLYEQPTSHESTLFLANSTSSNLDLYVEQPVATQAQQAAPKPRGRRPITAPGTIPDDPVKEKQRARGRETQRRFRERQKSIIAELEGQVESMTTDIEKEQTRNGNLHFKNEVMNNLLIFKDSQVALLDKNSSSKKLESRVNPEILVLFQQYTRQPPNLERLVRYSPAGYTDHLDDDSFAIQAAPLEVYMKNYSALLGNIRGILAEATVSAADISSSPSLESELTNMCDDGTEKKETGYPSSSSTSQAGGDVLDPQGAQLFEYCGVKYVVTEDIMNRLLGNIIDMGQQIWSMAAFFPNTMMAFSTSNLESGVSVASSYEYNDVEKWVGILRQVGPRREQLEAMARKHYHYVAAVRPVLRERAAIMQHLMQSASRSVTTIKEHIDTTADLGDLAGALAKIVQNEYVAWIDMMATIKVACLDFPVQQMLLLVSSYPYLPNTNLLGAAAALELGLNPFEYQFNESDFESAPFLRKQQQD